jgi:hypothetical protein
MAGHGFRGFRTFINFYFGPYPQCNTGSPRDTVGRQPYAFDTSTQKFNLLYWDEASAGPNDLSYWERVRAAVEKMAQAGFRKILITLGHVYSPSPWLQDHNINKYGDFGAQVPSCQGNTTPINIGGAWIANWGSLNQCQKDWIKAEYQRLAQKFMAVAEQAVPGGSQLLVFEVFNEAGPTTWPAHQELVQALVQAGVPAARIQVNIDAPLNGPCGCPNFDDTSFTTAWNHLIGSVGSWAVHSLWSECLTDCYSSSSFFWATMWTSGKLELSTDGQFCITGPTAPCCSCCHIQAGELLDAAIQRAGGDAKNLPFAFEHDTGLVRTDLPPANGIAWQAWELSEVQCLFRRHCGPGCTAPLAAQIYGRGPGTDQFQRPSVTIGYGDEVALFWNATFPSSFNQFSCSVPGVGSGTAGCAAYKVCATTDQTLQVSCNTFQDALTLHVRPVAADITANGSDGPIIVTVGQNYTIAWTVTGVGACVVRKNGADWATGVSGSQTDTATAEGTYVYEVFCGDCPQALDAVTVTTQPQFRTLTVQVHHTQKPGCAGGGAVSSTPAGINCVCTGNCGVTCSNPFLEGTRVTLTPEVIGDAAFTGWTGCDTVSGDICIVTMNADRSVSAGFASVGNCSP